MYQSAQRRINISTSLIGKAKELEVASILISNGLYVFFPLVDAGFDLVVTNRAGKIFIPVQVKYRTSDPALNLHEKDINNFKDTEVVVAWLIGQGETKKSWYLPFSKWSDHAVKPKRTDNMSYVTINKHKWLSDYEGVHGIEKSFSALL